jgi:hypothetical protein
MSGDLEAGKTTMTPEEEWSQNVRAGRRRLRPYLYGGLTAVAVWIGSFALLVFLGWNLEETHAAHYFNVVWTVPTTVAVWSFVLVVRWTGGKLAPEYGKGLGSIRRRS